LVHIPVVPPPVQVAPLATHIPPVQQPPLSQVLAGQQAWPVPPQLAPVAPPALAVVVPPVPPLRPPVPPLRPPVPPLVPPSPPVTPPPPPPAPPLGVLLPHAAKPSERAATATRNSDLTSPPKTMSALRFFIDQISRGREVVDVRGPRRQADKFRRLSWFSAAP
jgi:hypothetical protein